MSGEGLGWAGRYSAGQGRAGQGRAGQGRAGQGRAGQGRAERGGAAATKNKTKNGEEDYPGLQQESRQAGRQHQGRGCGTDQEQDK